MEFESIITIMNPELKPGKVVQISIQTIGGRSYIHKKGIITHRDDKKIKVAYCWSEMPENFAHHEVKVEDILEGYYRVELLKIVGEENE